MIAPQGSPTRCCIAVQQQASSTAELAHGALPRRACHHAAPQVRAALEGGDEQEQGGATAWTGPSEEDPTYK